MEQNVLDAVAAHHVELATALRDRVGDVLTAARDGADAAAPIAALHELVAGVLMPHARAEEDSFYPAAAQRPALAALVDGMLLEHGQIGGLAEEIALGGDPVTIAGAGRALLEIFSGHAQRENDLLLPGLAADPSVDLDALLATMHERFETARAAHATP